MYTGNTAIVSESSNDFSHHRTDVIFDLTGESSLSFDSLKVIYNGTYNDLTTGGGNPILFSANRNENGGSNNVTTIEGTTLQAEIINDSGEFFFVESKATLNIDSDQLYMKVDSDQSGDITFFDVAGNLNLSASDRVLGIIEDANSKAEINGILVKTNANMSIDVNDFVLINKSSATNNRGVYGYSNSSLKFSDEGTTNFILQGFDTGIQDISVTGQTSMFGILDAKTGIYLRYTGNIDIDTQSLVITTVGSSGYAIDNWGQSVTIESEHSHVVGAISNDSGTVNIDFGKESLFDGLTFGYSDYQTSFSFGPNSLWKVAYGGPAPDYVYTNHVQSLALDKATVNLASAGQVRNSITADKLTGTGSFHLLVDIGNKQATQILTGEGSSGTFSIAATLQNGEITDIDEDGILFAEDASQNIEYVASQSLTDAGLKLITPTLETEIRDNSTLWYLTQIKEEIAPTPDSILDGIENNYFFWRSLNDSTRERFGQLRHGASAGVWGRATAGSLSYGSIQNTYQTYRLGADASVNPDWKVGMMVEIHEGKLESSGGQGDMSATTAAIYALYTTDSGFYFDGGLRFGIMDYAYVNQNILVDSYDYNSSAFGGWIEIGHEWEITGGWTVSPHAAFSYGRFSAENFTTSNGLSATADSVDSGIFKVGADFGFKMDKLELFFTADAMHEALGDQTISVSHRDSSIRQSVDYSDTWAEYGANLSYRPSDRSLIWFNVRRSACADVEQDWRINLGARWLFK